MKYLCGPNQWNYVPTLELILDIKEFEQYPSDLIPHLHDSLCSILPSLSHHYCSENRKGGFLERVKRGTYFGHIIEHVALELQHVTGFSKGMGRTRGIEDEQGVYKIAISSPNHHQHTVIECVHCAIDLLLRVIDRKPVDLVSYQKRIIEQSRHEGIGTNLLEIIHYVDDVIPYFKPVDTGSFIQLGYGNRQQRLWITTTGNTVGIAESIVSNKDFTKQLLRQQGIHVPNGYLVESSAEAAKKAVDIGFPVTVKPSNGNHAVGVTLDITNEKDVEQAFAVALTHNKKGETDVIIEKYIKGDSYRVTLVNYRAIAMCRQFFKTIHVTVTGDGVSTLLHLIDAIKMQFVLEDCHRCYNDHCSFRETPVNTDELLIFNDQYLKKHKLTEFLNGRENKILEKDSTMIVPLVYDCYQDIDIRRVCPQIIEDCEHATRMVGLDICGIDLIAESIDRGEYAILELNSGCDIRLHKNSAHPVGKAMIEYLFPTPYYFPMIGITGEGNRSYVNQLISGFFTTDRVVGSSGEAGTFIYHPTKTTQLGPSSNGESVKNMLMNVTVEMAVIDNSSTVIDHEGLFYHDAHAIILGTINKDDRRLVNEPENAFRLLRTQIDIVPKHGCVILNADDPHVDDFLPIIEKDRSVIYYSLHGKPDRYRSVYYDKTRSAIMACQNGHVSLLKSAENSCQEMVAAIAGIWSFVDLTTDEYKKRLNRL
jgi:cyanophycin synthetase